MIGSPPAFLGDRNKKRFDKWVKVEIYKENKELVIILSNTFNGKVELDRIDDYGYSTKGKRYDVGDKLGFLQATVEFALKREELREQFIDYLTNRNWEK